MKVLRNWCPNLFDKEITREIWSSDNFTSAGDACKKSNSHDTRDFQTKTMRGGGNIYHKDPLFLSSSSAFMKFLTVATELEQRETNPANATLDKTRLTILKIYPINLMCLLQSAAKAMNIQIPGPDYVEICGKVITITKLANGPSKMF